MTRLLTIEWLKLRHYKAFWVLSVMYIAGVTIICSSGMFLMEFLRDHGADFDGIDPTIIPLYDFPDVWHNVTYIASFLKTILAFLIIISIYNEMTYRTLRQNVIDGLSKKEFLGSKLLLILFLSVMSVVMLFGIGLITGLTYSHVQGPRYMFRSMEFLLAYGLEVFTYLSFALLIGLIIRKAGVVIVLLLMYTLIFEPSLVAYLEYGPGLPDWVRAIRSLLPVNALNNLIHLPFKRYFFMEIQDYVSIKETLIVFGWLIFNVGMSYRILSKKDL